MLTDRPTDLARAIDTILARRSLAAFVKQAWHVVEPDTPLIWGWHIDALCLHLEAVSEGRIRQLLINVPPGHMKSLIVCVFWPAWIWLRNPSWRGLFGSYAGDLAIRDSLRCRDLISSPWYRETFRPPWRLRADQNAKGSFENTEKGFRLSLSVGGKGTGFRGDATIVDDPLNAQEADSELARQEAIRWWDQAMSSRLNDPRTGARVVIMQRLHQDDLSGHLIARGGYDHLCLPSEYDPEIAASTSIGWRDPRSHPGDLLFPQLFNRSVLEEAQLILGPQGYAGQHGQRPVPAGGSMFHRDWFKPDHFVDVSPIDGRRCRYWDKAGTQGGQGAQTAGVKLSLAGGLCYVEDVITGRWGAVDRENVIRQTASLDGPMTLVRYEQEPGSGGKESAQATTMGLMGYDAAADRVSGQSASKIARARPFASYAAAGLVRIVRAPWNAPYLDELCLFPYGKLKDRVDASSGAFNILSLQAAPLAPSVAPRTHTPVRLPQTIGGAIVTRRKI